MENYAPKAIAVTQAIDALMKHDRGRLLTGLITRIGDFQIAEDALQEALISALGHWARSGIPDNPTAWLMRVALNKSIDRIRKDQREDKKSGEFNATQEDLVTADYEYDEEQDEEMDDMIMTLARNAPQSD